MIELNNSNGQFDSMVKSVLSAKSETGYHNVVASLNTTGLKTISQFLNNSGDVVRFKPKSNNITARKVLALVKSMNPDLDIQYSEDLEDNDLVNISDKPLWVLDKNSNGVYQLQKAV